MKIRPVVCRWQSVEVVDGSTGAIEKVLAMVPAVRYRKVAGEQYAQGEEYPLIVLEPRDRKSHNHFFAAVSDAFDNLPEGIAARFPTADHLRRWVLVETNWFDEKEFDCPDEKFAKRLALFVRTEDEYARVIVHRPDPENPRDKWKVIVRRAMSQDFASMGKEAFQKSKWDVLHYLEEIIGLAKGSLMKNAAGKRV